PLFPYTDALPISALLANSFIASVGSDGKVASNVIATLATALTGWASTDVRANTSASDFDAELIVSQPTIVVLTCPGRMRVVYASYLGATLRKLMLDLNTIGELNGGPLRSEERRVGKECRSRWWREPGLA